MRIGSELSSMMIAIRQNPDQVLNNPHQLKDGYPLLLWERRSFFRATFITMLTSSFALGGYTNLIAGARTGHG